MYDETIQFQYLKTVVDTKTFFPEAGSQFVSLKSCKSMWERESKSKQRRIGGAVWGLCFRFLLRRGNHYVHPSSKWGWIKVLNSNLFSLCVTCLICLWRNLSFSLAFFKTFFVIDSALRLESMWHPKYLQNGTVWCFDFRKLYLTLTNTLL